MLCMSRCPHRQVEAQGQLLLLRNQDNCSAQVLLNDAETYSSPQGAIHQQRLKILLLHPFHGRKNRCRVKQKWNTKQTLPLEDTIQVDCPHPFPPPGRLSWWRMNGPRADRTVVPYERRVTTLNEAEREHSVCMENDTCKQNLNMIYESIYLYTFPNMDLCIHTYILRIYTHIYMKPLNITY